VEKSNPSHLRQQEEDTHAHLNSPIALSLESPWNGSAIMERSTPNIRAERAERSSPYTRPGQSKITRSSSLAVSCVSPINRWD
jgi:hypothetical protein